MEIWHWILLAILGVFTHIITFLRGMAFYRNNPEKVETFLDTAATRFLK